MKSLTKFKTTTLLFAPLLLACLVLLPRAQAVTPAPDGGYSGHSTAEGTNALFNLTTGAWDSAFGDSALFHDTIGTANTALGYNAMFNNIDGNGNTGNGTFTLFSNTHGAANTALGNSALYKNTIGNSNTAMGANALHENTSGGMNVGIGQGAGNKIIDGSNDVAVGVGAGTSFVHASRNIAIGASGAGPFGDLSDTCFIGSIHNEPVSDSGTAQAVYVDQYNVLGFLPSSRRFKHDIQPMDKASEAILAFKPVTFKYNSDKKGTPQYGLIAEEVAEVNPDLVLRGKTGIETVRYEQINAMLLNEFLKEHKKVQELEVTVAQQQKGMEALVAQVKEQAAQIQKVSAQVETSKPAPKVVANQ